MLSASLQAGAFDTNAKILLTCSLPDLRSLFATSPPQVVLPVSIDNEEEAPGNQETNEESEYDEEEGSESEEEQEPVSKVREENEEEEEEVEEEEEAWSSSDDEDIHQLVQTLQSYVEEAST